MRLLLAALAVVTLLAVSVLAVLLLPFTETGTRLLVELAQSVSELELEYESGSLLGDLALRRIRVPTEDVVVELRELRLRLDPDCLSAREICLTGVMAAVVDVEILLTDDASMEEESLADESGDVPFLPLPLSLSARGLAIENVRVHWDGGEISSTRISGDARLVGELIEISGASAHVTRLYIPDDGEESSGEPLELPEVEMPVELVVEDTTLYDTRWDIYDVHNRYDELEISGRWVGTRMTVSAGRLLNREWGEATLYGELVYEHPYPLQADVTFEATTPPLWEGLHGAPGAFSLQGSLAALVFEGRICGGDLPVDLSGEIDIVSREWPLSMEARGGCETLPAVIPLSELAELESLPGWSVADGWTLAVTGDFDRQRIALDGELIGDEYGPLQVEARGVHQPGRLEIEEMWATRADGEQSLKLAGELGYGDLFSWDLAAALDSLELPPHLDPVSGQLHGSLNTRGQSDGVAWLIELSQADISGTINELPANLSGTLRVDQALAFDGSDLDIAANGLQLRIVDREGQMPEALLAVDDFGQWVEGASGRLRAELQWHRDTAALYLNGHSEGLQWGEVQLRRFVLNGRYDYRPDDEDLSLVIRSQGARIGEWGIDALDLTLDGDLAQHSLLLSIDGDLQTALALDGSLVEGDWRGRLHPATLSFPAGSWELSQMAAIDFLEDVQQLRFDPHCWSEGGADLCIDQLSIGQDGAARLDLVGDLKRLSRYLPERFRIQGPLHATLESRWEDLEVQELTARLEVEGGELRENMLGGDWTDFVWERLTLDYHGDRDNGQLLGFLRQAGEETLTLDLTMPSALDGRLSGELVLESVELQAFENFIDELSQLQGKVAGSLQFSGRVQEPEITGLIALRDGLATLARSPTSVEHVSMEALFNGRWAELTGEAFVGGGSSRLQGVVDWREQPQLSLALSGGEKELSFPPTTQVTVAEDLLLEISAERFSFTGEVDIPRGELVLEELSQSAVEVSEDVVLYDSAGQPLRESSPTQIDMEVKVRIADQFRVSTEGIEGRVGGELLLRRRPGRPLQLFGGIGVAEGHFELLGPRFDVERGQLSFVGVPDNPQLDMVLERHIAEDQVTVGIRIGGNLGRPKLDFYSHPSLPEEEVMAYVLGGRGIDRTGNTDSLALALAATSGLMQSKGYMKGISLGVEGKDRKARAAIGGYVSDRIYMSYGIGLYQPVNTMTVRMDILRNFWLEVVSGLENSADMYYAWSR